MESGSSADRFHIHHTTVQFEHVGCAISDNGCVIVVAAITSITTITKAGVGRAFGLAAGLRPCRWPSDQRSEREIVFQMRVLRQEAPSGSSAAGPKPRPTEQHSRNQTDRGGGGAELRDRGRIPSCPTMQRSKSSCAAKKSGCSSTNPPRVFLFRRQVRPAIDTLPARITMQMS